MDVSDEYKKDLHESLRPDDSAGEPPELYPDENKEDKKSIRDLFEDQVKAENDLIGLSDDNLKKDEDGDYYDHSVDERWEYFKKGYNLGKMVKYRFKGKLEPPTDEMDESS